MNRRSPVALALLVALGVVLLQALLVPLFAAPAAHLAPRDVPIVVAGPDAAVAVLTGKLPPGAFAVTRAPDAAAADAALRDRTAYGALIAGPAGPSLHVASAAGPAVSALLTQAAAGMSVPVTDVVPTDPDDPRGAAFAAGFLPLAMAAMAAAALLVSLVRGRRARLTGLGTFAVLGGLAGAAVLQSWLGVLPGSYPAVAAVIGLVGLAVAAIVTGLGALLGTRGLGLGAVVVFVIGNALSAVGSAPELLPQPWGELGQWLPIGAGGTLLRSAAYFDGAGGLVPALILTGWAVAGLVLVAAARSRAAAPDTVAPEPALAR